MLHGILSPSLALTITNQALTNAKNSETLRYSSFALVSLVLRRFLLPSGQNRDNYFRPEEKWHGADAWENGCDSSTLDVSFEGRTWIVERSKKRRWRTYAA